MSVGSVFGGHFGSVESEGIPIGGVVSQIISGTGVTVSPPGGTGAVTVNADVASVAAADPGIVIADAGGAITVGQRVVADWPVANVRVYAVDFVNGNDAHAGFADAAGTSAGQYATACQAAGAVAKKTFAGLAAIFPRSGAGRNVEIVIANGGVNTQQAYGVGLDTFLGGVFGYNALAVRGTGTNVTAGCTAFDGSTADVTYQGGITVPTLHVAGYNPVGASTTSLPCQLAGGGAAALPAEPSAPLGWRVRFASTSSLPNQCRQIAQVIGGNQIIPQTAFSGIPANGDVFYVEQAGVVTTGTLLSFGAGGNGPNNTTTQYNVGGVRDTGTLRVINAVARLIFCGCATLIANGSDQLIVSQTFAHPVLGSLVIGGGVRSEGSASYTTGLLCNATGLVAATGFTAAFCQQLLFGVGCYGGDLSWQNNFAPIGLDLLTAPQIGTATVLAPPRLKSLLASAIRGQIGGCIINGAGALPAISLRGVCDLSFSQGVCSGNLGNNDVGLDLTASRNSRIVIGTVPTVTGALGDIRVAGGQIISWAQAIATGLVDSAGNRIVGPTPPLGALKFTGVLFGAVGPVTSGMADGSPSLLVANDFPVRYPTSLRLLTRLRVIALATSTNLIGNTVTLFKNGVATIMTVTVPAGTAVGTKFVDSAHPILFADGDDLALVIANAGADVGAVTRIGATLEYTI